MTRTPRIGSGHTAAGEPPVASSDVYEFLAAPTTAPIEMVELKLWPPRQGYRGKEFPLWIDLRISEETIVTNSWRVVIHLTRAEISAKFNGCQVARGTRYGDDVLAPSVAVTETRSGEFDIRRSGRFSTGLTANLSRGLAPSTELNVGAEAHSRSRTATETTSTIEHRRITTLPNDRWEIVDPSGKLSGTYLLCPESETNYGQGSALCRVEGYWESLHITASLEARPHDISHSAEPLDESIWSKWTTKERLNKSRIVTLLVTKACTDRFSRPGDERIILAQATLHGSRIR